MPLYLRPLSPYTVFRQQVFAQTPAQRQLNNTHGHYSEGFIVNLETYIFPVQSIT